MRIVSVISLSIVLLLSVSKDLSIYADYLINKKDITENICINRYEDVVMCFGQCYIDSKFLKSFESQDETKKPMQLSQGLSYVVPTKIELTSLATERIIFLSNFISRQDLIDSLWSRSVFRPPIS